jgi:hypothetical protein
VLRIGLGLASGGMEEKEEERKAELVCGGRWEVVGNGSRWRHGR